MSKHLSKPSKSPSDSRVISFIIILCLVCAMSLAIVAFTLQTTQDEAKEFDQNKQMMIAAKILDYEGNFQVIAHSSFIKAHLDKKGKILIEDPKALKAEAHEIKEVARWRIRPLLTDERGEVTTFGQAQISLQHYLIEHKKEGYASLPLKLFYAILPNLPEADKISEEDLSKNIAIAESFVFPIVGFGLWGPIYGYLACLSDGDTVLGTTWYEHSETPGLGANITEPWWQEQFYGKVIFQKSAAGKTDFTKAPLGVTVVKGKVRDVLGAHSQSHSAVDGISGATFTGEGVTNAYRKCLSPYRNLLIKISKRE